MECESPPVFIAPRFSDEVSQISTALPSAYTSGQLPRLHVSCKQQRLEQGMHAQKICCSFPG